MKFRYTGDAERDFVSIGAHIARDDVATALRFQSELESFIQTIAENPLTYRLREEWGGAVRAAPFGNYLIIYETDKDGILVVRIASGRRDIAAVLRERDR